MYVNVNTDVDVDVDIDIDDVLAEMNTKEKEDLLAKLSQGITDLIEAVAEKQSSTSIWRLHSDLSDNAKEFLRRVLKGE